MFTPTQINKTGIKESRDRLSRLINKQILALLLASTLPLQLSAADTEWPHYGGNLGGQQFTPLTQINQDNIGELKEAWRTHTGDLGNDFQHKGHSFEATPISWNGKLFTSTSANQVLALDATNGKVLWRFDAKLDPEANYSESASRGVSLWHASTNKQSTGACQHQIFLGTLDGRLIALDADTGRLCQGFANNGTLDLNDAVHPAGLTPEPGHYALTSPPVVAGNAIILGSAIGDNGAVVSERGIVRAVDARTGAELWRFDPIPRSTSNPAFTTWEDDSALTAGSANAWAPLSADLQLGLVYVPTSSASPDFYGGERKGDNLYTNSLVALNINTGAVAWHQQLIHHDVWDYDIPAQPTLVDITVAGAAVPSVLVVTKTGMLYAFDRRSGKPLFPMPERPVPASDVAGERLSPTQPYSAYPALADQRALGPDDAFGLAWFDKRGCEKVLASYRSEGLFTPPSLQGSIVNPSWAGGSNWGGVATDPGRQIAVTNVNQIPGLIRLIPRDELAAIQATGALDDWQVSPMRGTPYVMARRIFLSSIGLPCVKPPWGKLVAVDLQTAEILWEQPLGTIADLAPAPVPNFAWGVPNMGGPLLTESGLLIIGAAAEHKLRIFDTTTGAELWQAKLPTAAMATPMSYSIDGQQYIAVSVGGHSQFGLTPGDTVIAYKLPDRR